VIVLRTGLMDRSSRNRWWTSDQSGQRICRRSGVLRGGTWITPVSEVIGKADRAHVATCVFQCHHVTQEVVARIDVNIARRSVEPVTYSGGITTCFSTGTVTRIMLAYRTV